MSEEQEERIDYSELVSALQKNREDHANRILQDLIPRLKDYLKVTMNAEEKDAEECVHQAFLDVFEKIREDKIRDEKYFFSYILKACRHEYIKYMKHQHRFDFAGEGETQYQVDPPEQIQNLLEADRQRILQKCIEELEEKARNFIEYFIDKPDASTKEASRDLKLSGGNVRTMKTRILDRLHHCYKWKAKQ